MDKSATAARTATSLENNEHVKELYSLLQSSGKGTEGLDSFIGIVGNMDNIVKSAEQRMAAMQAELNKMKEIQDHPIKHILQNASKSFKARINSLKACISKVKNKFVTGCKKVITKLKELDTKALDKLVSFLGIKPMLQSMSRSARSCMNQCDKNISQIETFSKEYHKTGLHLTNMFRMIVGKDPLSQPKDVGKLATTVCNTYRKEKSFFGGIRNVINNLISKIEQLENKADAIRAREAAARTAKKAKAVPIMRKLRFHKKRIIHRDKTIPAPGLGKTEVVR